MMNASDMYPDVESRIANPASRTVDLRLGWGLILFILVLQFWSRYLPSPWAVFVADDWANFARSSFYGSHVEAFKTGLQDPNRPLSMAAVELLFRVFVRNPIPWTMLSLLGNSLLLLALIKMAMELTGRRSVAMMAGVVFALLPNLTETFHWSTQVLNEVSCALVFYALSGWMWVAYVRRGGGWRLAVSAFAYWVGIFSYEAGIFLPAAYIVLLPWRNAPIKSLFRLSPFGVVCLLYLAWRLTDAFGLNESWYYPPHMEAGLSLWGISWNIRQIIQWWVGDNMFGAILSGFQSFATLPPWTRRGLVLGNILAVGLIGWGIGRLLRSDAEKAVPAPFSLAQGVLFGVAWTGATMMILVLSYTAPRLNVLPAMGVSLLAAMLLVRVPLSRWGALLFVPAVLALVSNQGTAESHRQVGEFNVRLYEYLERTADEWRDKEAVLFDTRAMRNRNTPGLLRPIGEDPATWAGYQNARFLRGFVPGGMMRLVLGTRQLDVHAIHDVEYGARIVGDTLHWHERYNPGRLRTTPMDDVFVVDIHAVVIQ